jgi:hypothetical protein
MIARRLLACCVLAGSALMFVPAAANAAPPSGALVCTLSFTNGWFNFDAETTSSSGSCLTTDLASVPISNPADDTGPIGGPGDCSGLPPISFPFQIGGTEYGVTWNRLGVASTALSVADKSGLLTGWNVGKPFSNVTTGPVTDSTGAVVGLGTSIETETCTDILGGGSDITIIESGTLVLTFLPG